MASETPPAPPEGTRVKLTDGRTGTLVRYLPTLGKPQMIRVRIDGGAEETHHLHDLAGYADE